MPALPIAEEILARLRERADSDNVAGMTRYGINPTGTLGIPVPVLRAMATDIRAVAGRSPAGLASRHELAVALWDSGVHEARLLAAFVDVPRLVDRDQAERWVHEFDSWDVCDQVCSNLFDKTIFARDLPFEWSGRSEEFVRRAGFVMMAALAVHDKQAPDELFVRMLPVIEEHAADERNFVKKAVNWALRQIGKRNSDLHAAAIDVSRRLADSQDRTARWVGRNAAAELMSEKVLRRLGL